MKKIERKGGWQFWVDIHKKHVIKTPKNKKEIRAKAKKYLDLIGKSHELEKRVNNVIEDIKISKKIIEKSKIPRKYLAYPEFLEKGRIKQKRVVNIKDRLKELIKKKKLGETKKLINKFIKFKKKLWTYGIHEKPIKFHSNFGIIKDEIVLIDIFELTDNKRKIKKQLNKKPWRKDKIWLKDIFPEEIVDYYIEQADKELTVENLNKYWKSKK